MGPNEQLIQLLLANPFLLITLIAWTLFWKGLALWISARREQKHWFVAILILNTLGLLEIAYILYTRNKDKKEAQIESSVS